MSSRAVLVLIAAMMVIVGCESREDKIRKASEKADWGKVEKQIEVIEGPESPAKRVAVYNLGEMGAKAKEAIPALEKLRESADDDLKKLIDEALEKIKSE